MDYDNECDVTGLITGPNKSIVEVSSCRRISCFREYLRMDSHQAQFVGAPCGHHGPYTFYKAFKYTDRGKIKILSLGDFFFLKILEDIPVCIGEIQLLWEEKGTNQLLASVRMYFQPQDTPDAGQYIYGEDELLAVSEKLILSLDDLCHFIAVDVQWTYGRLLHCCDDLQDDESTAKAQIGEVNAELSQAFSTNNRGLLFHDVDKEKKEMGLEEERMYAQVVVMSYPQYCRYRSVLKRLETVTDIWLKNALVMAVGGFTSRERGVRVMFCREVCDFPELDDLEFRMDHMAPNLKGRPRKRKGTNKKDPNQDSDSNGYGSGSDQSSNTTVSSLSTTPKVRSQRLSNKNGVSALDKAHASQEEKEFLIKLYKFMSKRNQPIERLPSLGFKQIDLFLFYKAAQQLGGYEEITKQRQWKALYDNLGGNPGNTSAATCTRKHYERLILPYEKHLRRKFAKQQINKEILSCGKELFPPLGKDICNGQVKIKPVRKPSLSDQEAQLKKTQGVHPHLAKQTSETNGKNTVTTEESKEDVLAKSKSGQEVKCKGSSSSGEVVEGERKVVKMEDLFDVHLPGEKFRLSSNVGSRSGPRVVALEVPVVRQRMQTSIMSPIMHRKLHHQHPSSHHQQHTHSSSHLHPPAMISSVPSTTMEKPASSPAAAAASTDGVIRPPSYSPQSSHLPSVAVSSSRSSSHHHSSSSHHHPSIRQQTPGPSCHPSYNNRPAHQSSDSSSRHPQAHQPHINTGSQQGKQPRPAHSNTSSRASFLSQAAVPPPASLPGASAHHPARVPSYLPDPHQLSMLSTTTLPPPPPAHSNNLKRPNPFMEVNFPHPDVILNRIQNLHQSHYVPEYKKQKFDSPSILPPAPIPTTSLQNNPVDLTSAPLRNFGASNSRKDAVLSRPREATQGSSSSRASSASSNSSRSGSFSLSKQEASQPQQSEVLLQSALFGAQFTALPRYVGFQPAKPAEATLSPSIVPIVHPAFMQAFISHAYSHSGTPSSLDMYPTQLSPNTAMHIAAYEEMIRQQKAITSLASPFVMAQIPNIFPQPTNESPK